MGEETQERKKKEKEEDSVPHTHSLTHSYRLCNSCARYKKMSDY